MVDERVRRSWSFIKDTKYSRKRRKYRAKGQNISPDLKKGKYVINNSLEMSVERKYSIPEPPIMANMRTAKARAAMTGKEAKLFGEREGKEEVEEAVDNEDSETGR